VGGYQEVCCLFDVISAVARIYQAPAHLGESLEAGFMTLKILMAGIIIKVDVLGRPACLPTAMDYFLLDDINIKS
jgi:hypothetical protein